MIFEKVGRKLFQVISFLSIFYQKIWYFDKIQIHMFGKVGRNYFKFGDSNQHTILQRDVFASPFLLIREKKYVISLCDLTFLLSKLHTSLFVISFLPIFFRKHLAFCYHREKKMFYRTVDFEMSFWSFWCLHFLPKNEQKRVSK